MKKNTAIWLSVAAGVAVVGAAAYLLSTEKGKRATRKWRKSGEKIVDQFKDMLDNISVKCEEKVQEKKEQFAAFNN